MRPALSILAVLLLVAVPAPSAQAQSSLSTQGTLYDPAGPYAVISPRLSYRQPSANPGRPATSLRLQTSVLVPDGGEVLLGGFSSVRDGRNDFGTPGLGKTPFLSRGFNNAGYSRSISSTRASVRVRVIRLADEEERQTGVRR
jgi:type II secretory pathway component GspD/PulD (secretin)